ncbi:MAG: NAD(+)/NADH kinase [Chloroflexi bacterium]|nr:NAD(+)/NADH kinase [Chloroflexota bacterium]
MKNFLLLHHPKLPRSLALAQQWAAQFEQQGANATIVSAWHDPEISRCIPQTDLAITLGGDGTILRAARLCAPMRVPILGVKMGRVGFLSEIEPEQFDARVLVDGAYWIEERTMLHAGCARDGKTVGEFEALNDVVVGRGALARVIRLATFIDGDYLATFVADGAIVATATGSTAYVFAAGGPILAPEVKTLALVPIAPYLSQIKSLVLPEGSRVLFRLETDHHSILTIDGQTDVELRDGDEITVEASAHMARFARLRPRTYFFRSLVKRLRGRATEEEKEAMQRINQ